MMIMQLRIQDHHGFVGQGRELLVAQCISTSSSSDCETPFFPDDSDVRAAEFATFAVPGVVSGRPAQVSILNLVVEGVLIMSRRTEVADVPAVLYGVEEAAVALRLSRSVLYELIRSGQLRTVKQGRRRLVPVSALAEYVASLDSGVA
jgi:excisionase family DNA binding protein